MTKKPEVGDIWTNIDNQFVHIIKIYQNKSVAGSSPKETYRILEYTNKTNINVMECDLDDLKEFVGKSKCNISDLFNGG